MKSSSQQSYQIDSLTLLIIGPASKTTIPPTPSFLSRAADTWPTQGKLKMEKPGLNSAVWPNLSLPMSAVDNREANPKKAAPSNHRIPLRGHKYKKEKFITLGDDPANQSVGIEEINSSVVSFREAAAAQDIVAETSICLNILSIY